jgi:hypothetical protein
LKTTLTQSSKKRLLIEIANRLIEFCDGLVAGYVHGSFLKAEAFSDLDVGILLREKPDRPLILEIDLEVALEKTASCPVDVRVLNGAPLSFCQGVIRTGEVIVDLDPNGRADFEGWVLKKYFDFAPFRTRYLSEAANAPL